MMYMSDGRWEWCRDLLAYTRRGRQDRSECKFVQRVSVREVDPQLGLHRDGTGFGLSEYEIAERRQVWWEVVVGTSAWGLTFC
jgi:hypothetical protein